MSINPPLKSFPNPERAPEFGNSDEDASSAADGREVDLGSSRSPTADNIGETWNPRMYLWRGVRSTEVEYYKMHSI